MKKPRLAALARCLLLAMLGPLALLGCDSPGSDSPPAESVEGKVRMRDPHATILNLLGMDHLKLTYRYAGRDFRLTDVSGEVVKGVISG